MTEQVLVKLGPGACFGERALLRSEPRFASVRATSQLRALSITKDVFEGRFGPLADLLPDDYG